MAQAALPELKPAPLSSVRSLPNGRPQEALDLWKRWERWSDKDGAMAKRRADKALHELAVFCTPEIAEALNTYKKSGKLVLLDVAESVHELAHIAVLEAAQTLRDKPNRQLLVHVKDCAVEVLRETEAYQQEEARQLTPEQVVEMCTKRSRQYMAFVLEHLSFDQRNGLVVELMRRRLGPNGMGLSLDLGNEPEDGLLWLLWYIFRLHVEEAAASGLLAKDQETPTVLLVNFSSETGPQPRNSRGEPINLAGPILVKVFDMLTGLPNNRIPAPARSNTRLGRAFNVDPDVVARWKRHPEWHELRVNVEPDGEGGVHHTFDLDALLRSARIVMGCKRGPKTTSAPENSS
jgi:hypothetical protein